MSGRKGVTSTVSLPGGRRRWVSPLLATILESLAGCDEDTWAEWVNGEVLMVSPASRRHQALRRFIETVLGTYVEERRVGHVVGASFLMRLPHVPSGREPDLLFVATEHQDRFKETYLDGPADLVVEIVSPESRLRDRGEKFAEYELGGVGSTRAAAAAGAARVPAGPRRRAGLEGGPDRGVRPGVGQQGVRRTGDGRSG